MQSNIPLVSIQCMVYNHAPYLRQCLDGFVMQQTTFPFEAIVHDDVSTDDSAKIIAEYAEKYPDIIKPIYETENQYSKRDGSLERIINKACQGKYIALCEGDDYWTDPLKLQKQVDFMEKNQCYTMCFHNAIEHFQSKNIPDKLFSQINDADYSSDSLIGNWIAPTCSVLLRHSVLDSQQYKVVQQCREFIYGDAPLFVTCADIGKVRGMSDVMSVYRRHEGGVTNHGLTLEWSIRYYDYLMAFLHKFKNLRSRTVLHVATRHLLISFFFFLRRRDFQSLRFIANRLFKLSHLIYLPVVICNYVRDKLTSIFKK